MLEQELHGSCSKRGPGHTDADCPDRILSLSSALESPDELSSVTQPDRENQVEVAQGHTERVENIKRELVVLRQKEEEAKKHATEERAALWKYFKSLPQEKRMTSDQYRVLSEKIGEAEQFLYEQIGKKYKEYLMARIDFLSHTTPPDALRQRVLGLRIKDNLDKFQGTNIQAGGSNAKGVFEIENGDFVLIKKSKETYIHEAALPYLMQDVGTKRIPRVLEVFETDNATYKVMEKAAGVEVDKLSEEQVAEIPQEHYDQFVEDIASLDSKGLQIDPSKKSNFFYDNQQGFSIIDLADFHPYRPSEDKLNNVNVDYLRGILLGDSQDQRIINKIQKAIEKYEN